jgi:hypothetical protein
MAHSSPRFGWHLPDGTDSNDIEGDLDALVDDIERDVPGYLVVPGPSLPNTHKAGRFVWIESSREAYYDNGTVFERIHKPLENATYITAFMNDWRNASDPFWGSANSGEPNAAYWKDGEGVVHLRGMVANNRLPLPSGPIFNLPAGYRPQAKQNFVTYCHNGQTTSFNRIEPCVLVVNPDGNV